MEKNNFSVSLFADIRTKHPEDAVLSTVLSDIRNGKWEPQITACRQAYASIEHAPDEKSAKARYSELKSKLPCFTLCQCLGGHARQNIRQYHGLVPLDFDHLPKEMLSKYQEIAAQCIHTLAVFLTPSGQGLRILVPTTCTDPEQHLKAWLAACSYYEQYILPGVKADKATKDPSRVSFVSFDANATWHEAAEPMRVEMEGTAKTEETDARSSANAMQKQQAQMPMTANKAEKQVPTIASTATTTPAAAEFDLQSTLKHYLSHHVYPAAGGGRNNFLFGLCLYCKSRTISESELEAELQHRFAEKDFNCQEISQTVHSAYSAKYPILVPQVPLVSLMCLKKAQPLTFSDDENIEEASGEALREQTKCLIFEPSYRLPQTITCILEPFSDQRQMDVLLLTSITSLGACMYQVNGLYNRRKLWPTLFTFIIAPAGSGKGVMRWSEELITPFCDHILEESIKAHDRWKNETQNWEEGREIAHRNKQKFQEKAPDEPPLQSIMIPSTVSRSKLFDHILNNKQYSSIISTSEADSLANSSKADFGQFGDLLRQIWEHERISCSFKIDQKMKVVKNPRVALCLTGTPEQLQNMIPSYENGLQSRFLEYTFRKKQEEWQDVSPSGDYPDLTNYYEKLGGEIKEMLEWINKKPRQVKLTTSQWTRLNAAFRKKLKETEINSEDGELEAAVKRHGQMAFRVIMILSCIRAWEEQNDSQEIICKDEDFENAMKLIMTCLEHSNLLSTSFKKDNEGTQKLTNPFKGKKLLSLLPDHFTFSEAIAIGATMDLSRSTVYRYLSKAVGVYFDYVPRQGYTKYASGETNETSETK